MSAFFDVPSLSIQKQPENNGQALPWLPRRIKLVDWPAEDRCLWEAACQPAKLLDDGGDATALSPDTRKKIVKGYGFWLGFLMAQGWLEPLQSPVERVTRSRLTAYFKAMRGRGNLKNTIVGRFIDLRMALKSMAPKIDTAWILKPNGIAIRQMLRADTRNVLVPDAAVLFDWGINMMKTAKLDAPHRHGLIAFRDGLLIAILASRARRLRSMSLLRVGHELQRRGEYDRIELQPDQVKTKKYDAFNLPKRLTPFIDQYLKVIRPALLRGKVNDALWVCRDGSKLEAKGIQELIFKRSKVRFGVTFGPHRFRHAIATTTALRASNTPGLAAPLLGISKGVVEAHYDRANQIAAITTFQAIVEAR